MPSEKKMWRLRFVEKTLVGLVLLIVGAGIWSLIFKPDGDASLLQWGGLLLGILLMLLLLVQNVVDGRLKKTLAIANQSDDERFRSLYERSPTALITTDSEGTIVTYNPAAVKLLNTTTDKLKGVNFFDVVMEHSGHDESVLPSKVRSGITLTEEELRLKTFAEHEIWVLMSAYEEPQTDQRILSLIDMTQAKKIDSAKSEFVALATHQLRTPIAAIRWNYELLKKKLPPEVSENLSKYLIKVERNVIRMIKLIDDFLSVSQLETGTFAAAEEDFNLSEYFENILDEYDEKLTEKSIKVTRDESPENQIFRSDNRLFHIIISNLVSNAVKYMAPEGSLTLYYRARSDRVIIKVMDTGIGIPRPEQAQLFNRFFRASNARLHQTEGTGLGLYIVKQAVEQLGGTIEVESTENVQTIFTVELPMR